VHELSFGTGCKHPVGKGQESQCQSSHRAEVTAVDGCCDCLCEPACRCLAGRPDCLVGVWLDPDTRLLDDDGLEQAGALGERAPMIALGNGPLDATQAVQRGLLPRQPQ
jgi:hypothetical protein